MVHQVKWNSFQREVQLLDERLEVLRAAAETVEGGLLRGAGLAELEACREELLVAEEELLAQQREIAAAAATAGREGDAEAELPVASLRSDTLGVVSRVNSAAMELLQRGQRALTGKPLAAYVHECDRQRFRVTLRRLTDSAQEARLRLRLMPAGGAPVSVTAFVRNVGTPDRPDLHWLVLPDIDDAAGQEPAHLVGLALASTPVTSLGTDEVVARVAELTQQALSTAEAVRVRLGTSPTHGDIQLALDLDTLAELGMAEPVARGGDATSGAHEPRGDSGCRPVLAVPLISGTASLGTLEVFTADGQPLSREDAEVARLCAMAGAALVANAEAVASARRRADNLSGALRSRAVIEQAKGAIMAMEGCTADEAFEHLRVMSQRSNVKLRDVANALLETLRKNHGMQVG